MFQDSDGKGFKNPWTREILNEKERERFGHLQQGGCMNHANCNAIEIGGFRSEETKGDGYELGLQA